MSVYAYQGLTSLGLSETHVFELLPSVKTLSLLANEEPSGGFSGSFWHVVDGLVCATSGRAQPGKASLLDLYGPGSWFGEDEFLALPDPSASTYLSLTKVRLLRVPADKISDIFWKEANVSLYMLRMTLWRSRLRAEMLSLAKDGKPAARVVLGLALLVDALGRSSSHLPSLSGDLELPIPIKQAVFAEHAGLSRALVSLQLQSLVVAGWLRLDYGSLCMLKLPVWRLLLKAHMTTGLYGLSMPELLTTMQSLEAA